jgi:hypothetical protein
MKPESFWDLVQSLERKGGTVVTTGARGVVVVGQSQQQIELRVEDTAMRAAGEARRTTLVMSLRGESRIRVV